MLSFFLIRPNMRTLNVRARVAIRPVYSKLVLPSRKSLDKIINIKKKKKKKKIRTKKCKKNGGCPLIRACSLIRSSTVCLEVGYEYNRTLDKPLASLSYAIMGSQHNQDLGWQFS